MQNLSAPRTSAKLDGDKWREIIKAWRSSGESQKNYYAHLSLNLNTFAYIRSKVLK